MNAYAKAKEIAAKWEASTDSDDLRIRMLSQMISVALSEAYEEGRRDILAEEAAAYERDLSEMAKNRVRL